MKQVKASFTVEAALLMLIILPVLIGTIYLGFYLHDRAILSNGAYELATGALLSQEEKSGEELVRGRLLAVDHVSIQVDEGENYVEVTYQGSMRIPGLLMQWYCTNQLPVHGSVRMKKPQPGKQVRRFYSLKKVWGEIE